MYFFLILTHHWYVQIKTTESIEFHTWIPPRVRTLDLMTVSELGTQHGIHIPSPSLTDSPHNVHDRQNSPFTPGNTTA